MRGGENYVRGWGKTTYEGFGKTNKNMRELRIDKPEDFNYISRQLKVAYREIVQLVICKTSAGISGLGNADGQQGKDDKFPTCGCSSAFPGAVSPSLFAQGD